ncbi:MAG: LolA family protein [Flammeovirgaceae bacterium]
MRRNLVLLVLGLFICATTQAQSVDEILDKYYETVGGKKAWKKMSSMKMEGSAFAQGMDIPVTVYSKAPNKMKVELSINNMTMIPQAFDGETAWMINPFAGATSAQKLPEEQATELKNSVEFEPLYIEHKKKGHEITLEGKEEIDGVSCFKLKVVKNKNNDKDEATEYHFFDAENYVPVMVRSTAKSGPMKGTTSEMFFSDYQEVGKLMIPHYMEQKVNGQTFQKITFKTVEVNGKLSDDIFKFPGE